jgi:hypothetical protein
MNRTIIFYHRLEPNNFDRISLVRGISITRSTFICKKYDATHTRRAAAPEANYEVFQHPAGQTTQPPYGIINLPHDSFA